MDRFKKRNKKIELHLIGPLQSNKVKEALEVFDVIQTIDREKIVKKIKDNLNGKETSFLSRLTLVMNHKKWFKDFGG